METLKSMVKEKTLEKAKDVIEDLEKEFSEYEIESITAEIQLSPNPIKNLGTLQIKMKKK